MTARLPLGHLAHAIEKAVPQYGGPDGKLRIIGYPVSPGDGSGQRMQVTWYGHEPPTCHTTVLHDLRTSHGTYSCDVFSTDEPLAPEDFEEVWAAASARPTPTR